MAIDVDTRVEDGYLVVTVTGRHDLASEKGLFGRIVEECVSNRLGGILFDVRDLQGDIPLVDRYAFGEYLGSQQPLSLRMAFLASDAQFWSDKFMEKVAVNRGAQVKTTTDPDEARTWLLARD